MRKVGWALSACEGMLEMCEKLRIRRSFKGDNPKLYTFSKHLKKMQFDSLVGFGLYTVQHLSDQYVLKTPLMVLLSHLLCCRLLERHDLQSVI